MIRMNQCIHQAIFDAESGEYVCTKCGMVLGTILEDAPAHAEERRSLYHQMILGGEPKDAQRFRPRIRTDNPRDLSEFSNLCDKLRLPGPVEGEAWDTYVRLRNPKCGTRAGRALFSIFKACRHFGCGVSEKRIRDAIPPALGVRNVPTLAKTLFAFGDIIKIDAARGSAYYLNVEVASVQDGFTCMKDFDKFRMLAKEYYRSLPGNARSRAKKAVAKALAKMGAYDRSQGTR